MSLGTGPGATGESKRKTEVFTARADAARAARLAGHKSPLRRFLERLMAHRIDTEAPLGNSKSGKTSAE
jgi:hypothetical protein